MKVLTEPRASLGLRAYSRWRWAGYWLATAAVAGELGLGGIWDIARIPFVRELAVHLGYPSYFLAQALQSSLTGVSRAADPRAAAGSGAGFLAFGRRGDGELCLAS